MWYDGNSFGVTVALAAGVVVTGGSGGVAGAIAVVVVVVVVVIVVLLLPLLACSVFALVSSSFDDILNLYSLSVMKGCWQVVLLHDKQ